MTEEILSQEAVLLGDALIGEKEHFGEQFLLVKRDSIISALTALRDFGYDFFSECVGVDYSTWTHTRDLDGRFEIVYNLLSTTTYKRIFVKIAVDDGQTVDSARDVYTGAEYPEKEIGDLYGVVFVGNELVPGTRFILPDDWIGFPLRKEYPLGGEDVLFDGATRGPAVEDQMMPHAGESFEGKTGTGDVSGR
jgi:NADH-quinone oxidoreductase subunit C